MADILIGKNVTKRFGGVAAVNNVSFNVSEGEIFGLIGPNGSGKTTLLNCISGAFPINSGELYYKGTNITKFKAHEVAMSGIGRTFQVVRPFQGMNVRENVAIGAFFGSRRDLNHQKHNVFKLADEILEFVGLTEKRYAKVTELPVAQRKRLEMARALAMQPKLLLLDEVMAGLNQKEIEAAMEMVAKINQKGTTVIMVEHVMKVIMGICHRVMVLRNGEEIATGIPAEIVNDEEVIKAYLGQKWVEAQKAMPGNKRGEKSAGN